MLQLNSTNQPLTKVMSRPILKIIEPSGNSLGADLLRSRTVSVDDYNCMYTAFHIRQMTLVIFGDNSTFGLHVKAGVFIPFMRQRGQACVIVLLTAACVSG